MDLSKMRRDILLAACAFPAIAGAANAQEPVAAETTADTIVVFAQKREQRIQDVPISVSVFNAQLLQDAGVRDIKDLATLTPGLTVSSTTNETVTTARIRGVGTVGDNPGLESSVGIVIDNVYRPRNGVGFGDLGEIERIEVLKGPQGTLFGKNTSAGVIQVFSKGPEFDWGGDAEVTVGEYGTMGVAGALTGPIIEDKLAFRVYGARRLREGFLDVSTGEGPRRESQDNDQDMYTVRGQLLWTPTPDIDFKLIADLTERDENCCLGVVIPSVNPASNLISNPIINGTNGVNDLATDEGILFPANPFARHAYANRSTSQKVKDQGISGELGWDLGFAQLTSITAWRKWEGRQGIDIDYTSADIRYAPDDGTHGTDFDTFSQELRLAGENGPLNWLVGAFYAAEDLENRQHLVLGPDYYPFWVERQLSVLANAVGVTSANSLQAGTGLRDIHKQEDRTLALFTNNSWAFTDQLELTVGLRFTKDEKDLTSSYNTTGGSCQTALTNQDVLDAIDPDGPGPAPAGSLPFATKRAIISVLCATFENEAFNFIADQSNDEEEWTGTAKLAYRWTPDVMTYASYSRGYKAGGFNLDREQTVGFVGNPVGTAGDFVVVEDPDTRFDAEFVDSYEIGTKTTWLNGALLLNLTAFLQQYENFQLNTFGGTNFVVTSVPELESKGAEFEFLWKTPIDGLTTQGGVTYAKTKYGKEAPTIPTMALDGTISEQTADAFALLPGSTMSFAPEWSVSAGFGYETLLANDKFLFRTSLNGRWMSDYATASDLLPSKDQDSFTVLNGRIGIGGPDERWMAELFATNLTDEEYIQVGFNTPQIGTATSAVTQAGGYNPAADTQIYSAFLGAPRVIGATLRFKY